MMRVDLAVVGAGPAGLAAAAEAVTHGMTVALIDDNARPGGQYFRHVPPSFRRTAATAFDKDRARAEALFAITRHPQVTYLPEATVWDVPEPLTLAVAAGPRSGQVEAGAIVVAAGAHDRPVPFPGWTLPGVVSAGGVQNLIKGFRLVPGTRAAVAGNGPLLFLIGASLLRAGVAVAAVVEAAPIDRRLPAALPQLLAAPEILQQALDYRWALLRAGVPVLTGWAPVNAEGEDAVRAVQAAPIAEDGSVDRARARSFDCDLLVVGFGLVPSVELLRLAGAGLRFDRRRGGWLPERDEALETTRRNIFAAGDGTGIGGVELALIEGRRAAVEAAVQLSRIAPFAADEIRAGLRRRWKRLDRFRRGIEALFAPPKDFLALQTPQTVLCRCEEVTRQEIEERRAEGFRGAVQLKSTTRMGMGRCQGRNCMATLAALVAADSGASESAVALPKARAPARPIPIGDLLHETIPPPDLPADPHLPRKRRT
ncbi:MAG: FAD-dependent oxidoreductase [Alphaproteobacteria bacterium]|nr:FAD-dependent oxidoreductase [Alphaproteobacteria bacterium]